MTVRRITWRYLTVAALVAVTVPVIGHRLDNETHAQDSHRLTPMTAAPAVLIPPAVEVQAPATVAGCPTEDSCAIDYHDGVWHITPQTP